MWQAASMTGDSLDSSWTSSSLSSAPAPSLWHVLERGSSAEACAGSIIPSWGFCLKPGSSQGTGISDSSMRGDPSPTITGFLAEGLVLQLEHE